MHPSLHASMLTLSSKIGEYGRVVEKDWGWENWIINSDLYCMKKLVLKSGHASSLHYHKVKDETFHILVGHCTLELAGKKLHLKENQTVHIPPNTPHRFSMPWYAAEGVCIILEVSTKHDDKDVFRVEPSKKLPKPPAVPDTIDQTPSLSFRDGGI